MRQCVGVPETASVCELVQANPIREIFPLSSLCSWSWFKTVRNRVYILSSKEKRFHKNKHAGRKPGTPPLILPYFPFLKKRHMAKLQTRLLLRCIVRRLRFCLVLLTLLLLVSRIAARLICGPCCSLELLSLDI